MSLYQKNIGKIGERLAIKYLLDNNFLIIQTNFKSKLGEIDIIAEKNNKVLFIEVKTRIGLSKGFPYEAVDKKKISHMKKTAQFFLLKNNYKNYKLSLNLISIVLNNDLTINQMKYYENIEI
jgi:putative endonuclease